MLRVVSWVVVSVLAGTLAAAEPLDPAAVPAPLAPWVDWVLEGREGDRCPLLSGVGSGGRVCAWPTRLGLNLTERGGKFEQRWRVEHRLVVPLPGDDRHWPQAITVDGAPAVVTTAQGRPGVMLEPGSHVARGRFDWDALPELIQIPPQTALLSLRLETADGSRLVTSPKRDNQGRLWLRQRGDTGDGSESRLEMLVHRLIVDDVPMQLETNIELEVSGRSRELVLGRALPEGFVPMSLASVLPARIDADGTLRAQVRPGRFSISIQARREDRGPKLTWHEPSGVWAPSEVWVFEAKPDLRTVTVRGANPVDPQQTKLPNAWKNLPAFLMKPGDSLEIEEKRRGDADPAPDVLALSRQLWLDFDGGGYTIQDRIEGEVRRSSRLDMAGATRLGRAELNGRDQFITARPGTDGFVGIEVPRGAVAITADSRIDEAPSALPAVGWDQDFQSLSAKLQLPPGWRLLHASGVDRVDSTWVNRWNLLDLFTALIIVLAFGRLWGITWGAAAAVGMMLTYTESGAPQWAWLAVLIGEALARLLPDGRFAGWISVYRGTAVAALIVVVVPFAIQQARVALHPGLEHSGGVQTFPASPPPPRRQQGVIEFDQAEALPAAAEVRGRAAKVARTASAPLSSSGSFSDSNYEPDPGARITTGPGLPAWGWRSVGLLWNGPVTRSQELHLVLVPPWLTAVFGFLRVGLMAALGVCVVLFGSSGPGWIPRSVLLSRAAVAGTALLVSAAVLFGSAPARADYPSPELLDELQTRLLKAPECAPNCATATRMRLTVEANELELLFEVDALAATGAPLPGGARSWLPERVLVDGKPARGLRAAADGVLWVRLTEGKHQISLGGPLPDRDSLELPLPLPPHRVDAIVPGWVLNGVLEDGRPEGTLQLTRIVTRETSADSKRRELEAQELPAFVEVVRNIRLGLTWQVNTIVRRLTPIEPALRLDLPLLSGEAVTTAGIRIVAGRAQVALDPGIRQIQWQSTLAPGPEVQLEAESAGNFREVWNLDVSPVWHVDFEGIPVVHQPSATAARVRQWRPWPGEAVSLRISRPEGVEGKTATIDSSTLSVTPGLRATDSVLTTSLRSSRGGDHVIRLPEAAELRSVAINGAVQPIRQEGTAITVPLVPGSQQIEITWREPVGVGVRTETPAVDLGMDSVNASIDMHVPQSRWILLAGGPRLGPAVLFWSFVIVLALIAVGLGRVPTTPLRFHHWLLLGLGLTQVPIFAAAIVVVWLLALGARGSTGTRIPGLWFDLVQVALVGLTLMALTSLVVSIQAGLLGLPEMQISGNGSTSYHLRWYQDRAEATLPGAWVISVPLLVYRIAMLAWALWLAQALLRWLRWGWECFSHGELWRPLRSTATTPEQPPSDA
jgi:hypothetical protein